MLQTVDAFSCRLNDSDEDLKVAVDKSLHESVSFCLLGLSAEYLRCNPYLVEHLLGKVRCLLGRSKHCKLLLARVQDLLLDCVDIRTRRDEINSPCGLIDHGGRECHLVEA